MAKHIEESAVQHTALRKEPCTGCHTAHSSDFPRQLKSATREICYTCHAEMGAQVKEAKFLHGPVKQNDCFACHDPHGSNFTKVLKKAFPPEFYTGDAVGSLNWLLRTVTGLLFGLGLVWFLFTYLSVQFALMRQKLEPKLNRAAGQSSQKI